MKIDTSKQNETANLLHRLESLSTMPILCGIMSMLGVSLLPRERMAAIAILTFVVFIASLAMFRQGRIVRELRKHIEETEKKAEKAN